MSLTNTYMFLIKQGKYKTWPLLLFYVLTSWLAVMRVYWSFCFFINIVEQDLFGFLLLPMLKLNVGVIQCWILVELTLRDALYVRLTQKL